MPPGAPPARTPAAAAATPPVTFEVTDRHRTFEVLAIHIPELGAYNVYGTDVTAAKVVARFPDRNTNPVLRMSPAGRLTYANAASLPIVRALGLEVGAQLPGELLAELMRTRRGVAFGGSHGKTTSTSMAARVALEHDAEALGRDIAAKVLGKPSRPRRRA